MAVPLIAMALVMRAGAPIIIRLAKSKPDDIIRSVIRIKKGTFDRLRKGKSGKNFKEKTFKDLFIRKGKDGGLTKKGTKGMNHPAVTSQPGSTGFSGTVVTRPYALYIAPRNLIQRDRDGTASPKDKVKLAGIAITAGTTVPELIRQIPLSPDRRDTPRSPYDKLSPEEQQYYIEEQELGTGRRRNLPALRWGKGEDVGMKPDPAGWNVGLSAVPPKLIKAWGGREKEKEQPYLRAMSIVKTDTAKDRIAAEQRVIDDRSAAAEAPQRSPSSDLRELFRRAPREDRDKAEDMLGQLFGFSRSKSEIERDMAYTQLKEEELLGLQPDTRTQFEVNGEVYSDPDEYWDAWNANRKDELDIEESLGRKSGGRVLKKKAKKKVSRSYKPKSTKKQYAKNGSVRKPKRI